VKYLDVAQTAAAAIDRDRDKARAGFDAAMRKYGSEPIAQDIAFMRGQLELRAGDAASATEAFKKALELSPGGRAHFGLAQAAFLAGDTRRRARSSTPPSPQPRSTARRCSCARRWPGPRGVTTPPRSRP